MRITKEIDLKNFEAWSGGVATLEGLKRLDLVEELENQLNGIYSEGLDETQLNDLLWFEDEWVCEMVGTTIEELYNNDEEGAE